MCIRDSYIASWEGDDEDDELDEGPLWDSVLRTFRKVKIGNLGVSHGIADKEKKSFLESVRELVKFDLISFVPVSYTHLPFCFRRLLHTIFPKICVQVSVTENISGAIIIDCCSAPFFMI